LADINSDGYLDALFITNEGTIRAAMGKGDGTLADQVPLLSNIFGAYLLQLADFNRDRKPDLLVYGWGNAAVFPGDGRGHFDTPKGQYLGGIGGDQQPLPTDVNRDGLLDFLWVDSAFNKVSTYAGNGDGTFRATSVIVPANRSRENPNNTEWGTNLLAIAGADFNGDGLSDVLAYDTTIPGQSGNFFGLSDGKNGFKFTPAITAEQANKIASEHVWFQVSTNFADFNEDGRLDLISEVENGLVISLSTSKGALLDAVSIPLPIPNSCIFLTFPEIGDLNHDGHADLVTRATGNPDCGNSQSGFLVSLGDGTGHFTTKYYSLGNALQQVGLADLNNDGNLDLLAGDAESDGGMHLTVVPGLGNGEFDLSHEYEVSSGYSGLVFTTGDYDADGKQDVALMSAGKANADGTVQLDEAGVLLIRGNGDFTFGQTTLLASGVFPYNARIVDLNHDGKPEVVASEYVSFNPAEPTFGLMVFPNLGNGTFGKPMSYIVPKWDNIPLGLLETGDFNGDGLPDALLGSFGSSAVFMNVTGQK
jgi:hypothetical protein